MTDSTISALPAAAALTGTELVPIVQSGVTNRCTAQAIADLGGGAGAVSIVASDFTADATDPYITLAIPGGSIGATGTLEIESFFTYSGTQSTLELSVSYGSASAIVLVPIVGSSGDIDGRVVVRMTVQNINSESSNMFDVNATWGNSEASGVGSKGLAEGYNTGGNNGLRSVDTASNQNFIIQNNGSPPTGTFTHRSTVAKVTA